jgi:hypothetical protein
MYLNHMKWCGNEKPPNMANIPICSMYGVFTYIWVIYGVNVGKYSIHGAYGICKHKITIDLEIC